MSTGTGGGTTLLKLLARITEPTEGRISGYGRVGSLHLRWQLG
jgi:ABC-type polysaccharide/polyol phosphate transport system ATPase subunit